MTVQLNARTLYLLESAREELLYHRQGFLKMQVAKIKPSDEAKIRSEKIFQVDFA